MKRVARFIVLLGFTAVAATAEWPIPPQSTCYYTCFNAAASPKFRNYQFRTTEAACCSAQCPAGWTMMGVISWGDPAEICYP